MTRILSSWLRDNKLDWYYGSGEYGCDLPRNQNIIRFLREDVPLGYTHVLLIDADMAPVKETEPILTSEEDLAYCGYVGKHGTRGHMDDGDFGCGCARISAKLLQDLEQPYFHTTIENNMRIDCECHYFLNQAQKHGYSSKMVGICGHEQTCVIFPWEGKYKVCWEENII